MSTGFCAHALQWWLEDMSGNPFIGAKICTKQVGNSDQFTITKWEVDGIEQPTDEEIEQIIADYESGYVPPKTEAELIAELEARIEDLEGSG